MLLICYNQCLRKGILTVPYNCITSGRESSKTPSGLSRRSLMLFMMIFTLLYVPDGFCFTDVVTYVHPEETLMARIEVPVGTGPFPVVMAIHGGGFVIGDRTAYQQSFFDHYTDLGYAVIATEYRLISEAGKHPGPIRDCLHNLHWLIDHADEYGFDTDHIVVHGSSAGSYLAMMVGLTAGLPDFQPDFGPYQGLTAQVEAVVSSAGIYDWMVTTTGSGDYYIGDYKTDPDASPVHRADDSACPSFLILGGEDDSDWSPPAAAYAMDDSLIGEGIYSELYLRQGQDHPSFYDEECGYCVWAFVRIDPFLAAQVASPTGVESGNLPSHLRIVSASPNPFNPTISIRYELPVATLLSIRVIDLSGRTVRTLRSGIELAGRNEVMWDGRNDDGRSVSSGMYFTSLEAGGETRTKKITLIR